MTTTPRSHPSRCGTSRSAPGAAHPCTVVAIAAALTGTMVLVGLPGPAAAAPAEATSTANEEPAPPAEGGDDKMLSRAMAAYERGQDNYKRAQYEAALADFSEAASLYASPDFQYNIGLCYEKLGRYGEAVRAYSTYLKVKPDAEDRVAVEATIKRLQALADAREVDEADDADDPPAVVPEPQPQPQPDTTPPPKPAKPLIIAGAAIAGIGAVVALGGGIAFGVLADRRSDDLDAVQTGGNPDRLSFGQARALEDDGKRFEGLQIGMAAGGAAVAVVGVALLAVGLRRQKSQAAGPRAQLVPQWSPGGGGIGLSGRF